MTMFAEIKLQETMPQTRAQGQAEQLKHQQDKIDQQKTRIEVLEAKVKKQEAHLFQWRKYPQEMHASLSHKPARKSEPEGLSGSVKKAKRQAEQIASAAREAYTYTPEYRSIVHAERVLYPDYPDDAGAPEHRPPARLVWGNQLFKGN